MKVQPQDSPFNLKIESNLRKTLVDDFASKSLIIRESMPSFKNSIGIDYGTTDPNVMQTINSELSFSKPLFCKFNA